MARRPQERNSLGGSSDSNTFVNGALRQIVDNEVDDNDLAYFLINPSTWDENKSTNWAEHNIPGQPAPIYQWVSGGSKTLTFEALVTKDTKYYPPAQSATDQLIGKAEQLAKNFVGSIASSFAGVNLPPIASFLNPQPSNSTLDITDNLNYYRDLLEPTYDSLGNLTQSPTLLVLDFDDNQPGSSISNVTEVWILTNLNIKITKQTPDLYPMEALVTFQLANYIFGDSPNPGKV